MATTITPDSAPHPKDWAFPMMLWDDLMHHYLRALAQEVKLRPDPEFPDLFALATSGSTKGVEYRVNEFYCACEAGQHDMACKHRALFLVQNMRRLGRVFYTADEATAWLDDEPASAIAEETG